MHHHGSYFLVGVALGVATIGCADGAGPSRVPAIDSVEISAADLPEAFDTLRTFRHRLPVTQADSLLRALLAANVDVRLAWRPISSLCANGPIGPVFTIELGRNDVRVLAMGFERGEGWLGCAWRLMRYEIARPG